MIQFEVKDKNYNYIPKKDEYIQFKKDGKEYQARLISVVKGIVLADNITEIKK